LTKSEEFKHDFPFDPRYGYDQDQLLKIKLPQTTPKDFDEFWADLYAVTLRTQLKVSEEAEVRWASPKRQLKKIYFDTLGGYRIGAWLSVPIEKPTALVVVGHGYGGRGEPDFRFENAVQLSFCAPGLNLSAAQGIPNTSAEHVIYGIERKENYLIGFCVAAIWSSVTYLCEAFPELKHRLYYQGTSFGGGLGALALPWDKRIRGAQLTVPTFGHHPLRLICKCIGSGESVRQYHQRFPEIVKTLAYFDAATSASKITQKVLVAPALFDPAVPPPGQFAIANALPNKENYILAAGHYSGYASEAQEYATLDEKTLRWFELK
jgi:cephalosporin-C deacetylase